MSLKIMNRYIITLLGVMLYISNLAHADQYTHPRLFFSQAEETQLKARIKSEPLVGKLYNELIRRTDKILNIRPTKHQIKDGRRLLGESRHALGNILHTAMAWRLTGDKKYLNRAILELDTACRFKDWNPSHFLDTAEMSTAVAIGYDWLYHDLSLEQRDLFSKALIKLGREPARAGYTQSNKAWWSNLRNNWTQVCATGLLITERVLEKKGEPIHRARLEARAVLERCREFYQPNGGYPEGASYWHYGSNYHILGLAAVRSDQKEMVIPTPPEFERSTLFPARLAGPTGILYNFADSGSTAQESKISPAQSWMAREFNDPSTVRYIREAIERDILVAQNDPSSRLGRLFPFHLIWLPQPTKKTAPPIAIDSKWLGSQPIATFRGSWDDPKAMFLAIKGGLPKASHAHMDIGSFVFESDGVRWIEDLGSENYNLPGYFSADEERWQYFRLNNFSHNTLVIGGKLQEMDAGTSPITEFESKPEGGHVTIDMSPAYKGQADKVVRRAVFNRESKTTLITDTISAPAEAVRWAIMTRAEIKITGSMVTLKRNGKTLQVFRNDNHGGVWKVLDAKPPTTEEEQNENYQILSFTAPIADEMKLSVTFKP
ncbi:MAG: hypothetical protein ACJAR1_002419 [Rubritalea sp.]|jgi:hypothetical protein